MAATVVDTNTDQISTPPAPVRTIRERRSLPSGRALIGALLVTIGALGTFALATGGSDGPTTSYLVAVRDLEAGDTLSTADVRFEPMVLSADLAATSLNSVEGLDGAVAIHSVRAGALVDLSDVIGAATLGDDTIGSTHEISFGIPLERSPSGLVSGDRVTILATTDGQTTLAVEDAVILEIDTQPNQIGASGRGILTLAIDDPVVVMEVAHLTQIADITVVRSTRALADRFPAAVGGDNAAP